jgi:hypothetical protein
MTATPMPFGSEAESLPKEAFCEHLRQIATQYPVQFAADVYGPSGLLVVPAGMTFGPGFMAVLSQADWRDWMQSLSWPGLLTVDVLEADFRRLVLQDRALDVFAKQHGDLMDLQRLAAHFLDNPGLRVHLTLLKSQLPAVYDQALFTAWLGLVFMRHFKRNSGDPFNVFALALSHDFGMLYLPEQVVSRRQNITFAGFSVLKHHVHYGYEVLKQLTRYSDEVLIALLEHHEQLDGTGYPQGKVGGRLSRLGHLMGFLDAINALYTKRLKPGGRSLRDLIPMIQMNGHSRFGIYGKKLIEWLKDLPESTVRAVPNVLMPFLIQAVRDRNTFISASLDVLDQIAKDLGFRHGEQTVFALQNAIIHINIAITQSGIINVAYMRWLDQVETEALIHAYREVEDVFFMMQEVIYHIGKLRFQIDCYLMGDRDSSEAYKLKRGLERLERIVLPTINPALEILWIASVR